MLMMKVGGICQKFWPNRRRQTCSVQRKEEGGDVSNWGRQWKGQKGLQYFEIFLLLIFCLETPFFFLIPISSCFCVSFLQVFFKGLDGLWRHHFIFSRSKWSEVSKITFSSISQRTWNILPNVSSGNEAWCMTASWSWSPCGALPRCGSGCTL